MPIACKTAPAFSSKYAMGPTSYSRRSFAGAESELGFVKIPCVCVCSKVKKIKPWGKLREDTFVFVCERVCV